MTLEELKQKNAEAAATEQAAQPEPIDNAQAPTDDPEPDDVVDTDTDNDDTGEESDAVEVPPWMQTDGQTSEKGQVPVGHLLSVKKKLKGRLTEKDSEIDQLRQDIQQLKASAAPPPPARAAAAPTTQPMPKLEDFYDKPDPDAAHNAAVQLWISQGVDSQLSQHFHTQQQQQQRERQSEQVNQSLDEHYERAAKIVGDGLLSAEEYQGADSLIRQTVESINPGRGDSIVDALLGRMGEGSEKVVVSLARNSRNLNKFRKSLQDDPTGITAAAFLGELKGTFSGVANRVSTTPRPGSRLKGDGGKDGGAALKQYKAAHKSNNRQKAFDLKRSAKASGVDVSTW